MKVITWTCTDGFNVDLCKECSDLPSDIVRDWTGNTPVSVSHGLHYAPLQCAICDRDIEWDGREWSVVASSFEDLLEKFPLSEGYPPIKRSDFKAQRLDEALIVTHREAVYRRRGGGVRLRLLRRADKSDNTVRYYIEK